MTDAILNMVRGMQLGQHFEEILKAFLFDAFGCIVWKLTLGEYTGRKRERSMSRLDRSFQ